MRKKCIDILSKSLPLTDEVFEKFLYAWDKLDNYVIQEKALTAVINANKKNTDVSIVLLKCTVLNQFYSTRINSNELITLAKHIVSLNIDNRLKHGDWSVVSDIAECQGLDKNISFASKYCNWHNQEAYPIYDKYVVDLLCVLKDKNILKSFTTKKLIRSEEKIDIRYKTFGNALSELVLNYNLTTPLGRNKEIIFKVLDRALWILAKFCFGDEISVIDIAEALDEIVIKKIYDKYIIHQAPNGAIAISENGKNGEKWLNTKTTLLKICKNTNIQYDSNTKIFELGQKIIEYINNSK